ncbi:MAG: DNA-directed RNA polymerase subunit alpha [Chloroflexi bacterium]|nr:DNA-directed RNA polymerase subunit alpha [Chloroflexota bacterium]
MAEVIVPTVTESEGSTATYGKFVAEPLESGMGTTVGNSLRRVLLGGLTGAAIARVRIEGALHEFATLSHMKEDVTEFLLNVKEIRLRSLSGRPGRLFLDASGKRDVKAMDIQHSADFDIVNRELHLATLDSSEARLSVEFEVELGKGYVPASPGNGHSVGVIPLDALFSPVQQVNFNVEPTRVGEATGYERLVLEVWTDGSITSTEAVRRSAELLVQQFNLFARMGEAVGISSAQRARHLDISPLQYELPIESLALSQRTLNCLKRAGLNKVGQVMEKTPQELMSIRHFGEKSWEELEARLKEQGLLPSEPAGVPVAVKPAAGAEDEEEAEGMEEEPEEPEENEDGA